MKNTLQGLSMLALTAAASTMLTLSAHAEGPVLVTNGNDSGAGSLRAALEAVAKTGKPGQILIVTKDDIKIDSTLDYAGTAALSIHGNGQAIKTDVDTTLLVASSGADLTINDVDFRGPGGFSIENRGEASKGIFIDIRDDQTGVVTLVLEDVDLSGVAYHGIHISDCNLADDCGAGASGEGDGSEASIVVRLTDVEISDVGNGRFDADGIRVDERSGGDILFYAKDAEFTDVGADGVELDEGQEGSVFATAVDAEFDDNGAYCNPKLLKPFLPKEPEGEFEDGKADEADIPGPVTGTADDACIEREVDLYDSGSVEAYEFGIDLDDGFDIDEAGPGNTWVLIVDASVEDNHDEGLDFGEKGDGDLKVSVWRTEAKDNTDDGFKFKEAGPGNVQTLFFDVTAKDNGGKGASIEQKDEGTLNVIADQTTTSGNDDGNKSGLEIKQKGTGEATLRVRASDIKDGIDAEGVNVIEE